MSCNILISWYPFWTAMPTFTFSIPWEYISNDKHLFKITSSALWPLMLVKFLCCLLSLMGGWLEHAQICTLFTICVSHGGRSMSEPRFPWFTTCLVGNLYKRSATLTLIFFFFFFFLPVGRFQWPFYLLH